jgi:hypothetical protein
LIGVNDEMREGMRRSNLVLGRLGVEKGEEHVPIAVSFGIVSAEYVAERRWGGVGLVEKGTGRRKEGVHGVH